MADSDSVYCTPAAGAERMQVTRERFARADSVGYGTFEVRLHRLARLEPLRPELRVQDDEAIAWLEERVQGIRREEGQS